MSYEDGDKDTLDLRNEFWRYHDDPILSANVTELVSNEQKDIRNSKIFHAQNVHEISW